MEMNFEQITELLNEISSDIKLIKRDLEADYKILHGNGSPGIIDKFTKMEIRMASLEFHMNTLNESKKNRLTIIGTIVANAIAILSIIISYMTKK